MGSIAARAKARPPKHNDERMKKIYNKYIISVTDYRGTGGVSRIKNNKKRFSLSIICILIIILYKSAAETMAVIPITDFFLHFYSHDHANWYGEHPEEDAPSPIPPKNH